MYFQGDDELDLSHFKFFREFSSDKYKREHEPDYVTNIMREKGYDTLERFARPDSVLGRVKHKDSKIANQMLTFIQDLSTLVKENDTLRKGQIINTYIDSHHRVHSHHLKLGNEELLVIKNFGGNFHKSEYGFANFPEGNWQEVFNSDKEAYGGSNYINETRTINAKNQAMNLAPNAVIILRKV